MAIDQILNIGSFILQLSSIQGVHPHLAFLYGSFQGAGAPVLNRANRWHKIEILDEISWSTQDLLAICTVWQSFPPVMRNRAFYNALTERINDDAHPDLVWKFNELSVFYGLPVYLIINKMCLVCWVKIVSPPGGLEPPTFRLTAERASQLRHGGLC